MFHHGVGDFLVAFGRQAVHEHGVGPRLPEEGVVHLIVAEGPLAFHGFLLLAHARPDVGIHRVRAGHRGSGIVRDREARAGHGGQPFGLGDHVRIG